MFAETLEVEMRLRMKARQKVTAVTAGLYRRASKKEERLILILASGRDGMSGCHRIVLRQPPDEIPARMEGVPL